ncbi:MAG: hypothetical protein J0L82_04950 [Deltaproteobacteria bacterium]|jgi:hypothetical protein|nr:hypothetical protein [Deltaproteobacteria bacterium]
MLKKHEARKTGFRSLVDHWIRPTGFSVLYVVLAMILGSCGNSKSASLNIGLSVTPEKVFVVPGAGSSCTALADAKDTDTPADADVGGERALFSDFSIQWRSPDALTISSLRATLSGFAIDGGKQVIDFDEGEITALTGLDNLTIESEANRTQVTVSSSSTARKGPTTDYAPCGLHLGGIKTKTTVASGVLTIKIELVGYSTAADGSQAPVRQSTTVRAEKF